MALLATLASCTATAPAPVPDLASVDMTPAIPYCETPWPPDGGYAGVILDACPGHTATGLPCHHCGGYNACSYGIGYCVDAAIGCDDPMCSY